MRQSKDKTWIIDVDKSLPEDDLAREHLEKLARAARERLAETGAEQAYVQVGPVPDRTAVLILAAYVLGPLAPVLLRQGHFRLNVVWACLGLASLPLWIGMLMQWESVAGWAESGRLPFALWFGGVGVLTAFTFAAWSRAVFLAGWDARFFPERLPGLLSNPFVSLVYGLCAPGLGLLVHNAPRRASWALWNAGVTLMAVLMVWQTRLLWKANAAATSGQLEPQVLEYVLLGALGTIGMGLLVWLGSALDGARCSMHRLGHRMQGRGEWLVIGVLVASLAFVATFRPEALARELDRASGRMQQAGMQVLPALGSRTASELDPAQPTYALRLAQVYEERGEVERSTAIRNDLERRWSAYRDALEAESIAPVGDANDPWIPFGLPSVAIPGAHLSEFRAWSKAWRESLQTRSVLYIDDLTTQIGDEILPPEKPRDDVAAEPAPAPEPVAKPTHESEGS